MEKRPALGKGLSALIPDAPEPRVGPLEVDVDRLMPNALQPRAHGRYAARGACAFDQGNGSFNHHRPQGGRSVSDHRGRAPLARRTEGWLARVPGWFGTSWGAGTVVARDGARRKHPARESESDRRGARIPAPERRVPLTQEDIATAVGKDRASVANFLRLLKLPDEIRADVAAGTLSMGHARALLALVDEADQRRLARDVIARHLSVRETESLVKKIAEGAKPSVEPAPRSVDVHTRAAEDRLRLGLGTRVRIIRQGTRGRIEIDFASEEELIRIFEQLTQR